MIVVIEEWNAGEHASLLDDMFRLRARIFGGKLGWAVTVRDGQERDRFDQEGPVYIVHTDQDGRVNASCRLLPTTGPTLLAETFADTLPAAAFITAPSVWECTRFCVDYGAAGAQPKLETLRAAGEIVAAIGTVTLRSGVDTVLGNFDAAMLRIYRRVGCEVEVLGSTSRFGRPVYLGAFRVTQARIDSVRSRLAPPTWAVANAA